MAETMNLQADSGRNIIGDDAQPSLTLENSSTGNPLHLRMTAAANASLAGLIRADVNSVASAAVLRLDNQAYVSAVSLIFAAGANWAGMGAIRVVRSDGSFGWVPVLPDAKVTAAAVE